MKKNDRKEKHWKMKKTGEKRRWKKEVCKKKKKAHVEGQKKRLNENGKNKIDSPIKKKKA